MSAAPERVPRGAGLSPDEIRAHYREFAELLTGRRDEIIGRVQSERQNLDEQIQTTPGDDADVSVIDTSADYFLQLANGHQRELLEIRNALDRMHRGVYGVCESCESTVGLERLKHLPYARLCVDCQSAIEGARVSRRLQNLPKL